MVSFLDRHGVRHAINVETWVSLCCEWVVTEQHLREQTGIAQMYELSPRRVPIVVDKSRFGPSDAPITCIACVADIWAE